MDGAEAITLFRLLKCAVKPGGRVITTDPVFIDNQNPIAWLLISLDRGLNVRTPEGYRSLTSGIFDNCSGEIMHLALPPYTRWVMTTQ